MAQLPTVAEGRILSFHHSAGKFTALSAEWTESISAWYRIETVLVSAEDHDPAALVGRACCVNVRGYTRNPDGTSGIMNHRVHGFVSRAQQREKVGASIVYAATVVPRFARLGHTRRSRVFLGMTVPDLVTQILKEDYALVPDRDFEFRLDGDFKKIEYCVQYAETDLDFVHRLLEHWGIFYFFEHVQDVEENGDKIVFCNAPAKCGEVRPNPQVRMRPVQPGRASTPFPEETIETFVYEHSVVPASVLLNDYNYNLPKVDLKSSTGGSKGKVDPLGASKKGHGTHYLFGEHFDTPEEGEALATIREEEARGSERSAAGTGDVRGFRAGALFQLTEHYSSRLNRTYLITEVKHVVEQPAVEDASDVRTSYRNEFVARPSDAPYRPRRITPKPRIPGALNAVIDAGDGSYPLLDEQGRYKVRLPFDLADREKGKASHYVRMAQPYGAPGGIHFPIHDGVEVLLTHENGDPDRPVIAAAVPNPATPSVVTAKNHTQCILQSAASNALLFDDTKGEERTFLHAVHNLEVRTKNDAFELVLRDRHSTVARDFREHTKNDSHRKVDRDEIQEIAGSRHVTVGAHDLADVSGDSHAFIQGAVLRNSGGNWSEDCGGMRQMTANDVVITAVGNLTLQCGPSSVVLDSSGVTITGPAVVLDGGAVKIASGPGTPPSAAHVGSTDTPKKPNLPMEPGTLEGEGAGAAEKSEPPSTQPTPGRSWIEISLEDEEGQPIPRATYEVKTPDGAVLRGRLNKKGEARIDGIVPGQCEVSFPGHDKGEWQSC